jgi:hypothetical protein
MVEIFLLLLLFLLLCRFLKNKYNKEKNNYVEIFLLLFSMSYGFIFFFLTYLFFSR